MHLVSVSQHEIFQALADPIRVRIVRLMATAKDEVCSCELAESLDEPEYKLSRHISILKRSGIITSVRDGKFIYHSLVTSTPFMRALFKTINLFDGGLADMATDYERLEKRKELRERGRCRQMSRLAPSRGSNGKRSF